MQLYLFLKEKVKQFHWATIYQNYYLANFHDHSIPMIEVKLKYFIRGLSCYIPLSIALQLKYSLRKIHLKLEGFQKNHVMDYPLP